MKKKTFNPFKHTMDQGTITVGTIGMMGVADNMPHSPSKAKIIGGMDTMKILPTTHAVGGVFQSLDSMGKIVKKKRR